MGAVSLAQATGALSGYAGTADNTQIGRELAIAEAQIADMCGWPANDAGGRSFETATYTVLATVDPLDPRRLLLPLPPASVTSATVSGTLIDASKYAIDGHSLYGIEAAPWTRTPRGNVVVLVAGWDEGEAPDTLVAAVQAQFLHRWRALRTGQGVTSASMAGKSISREASVQIHPAARQAAYLSPAWSWSTAIA